MLVTFLLVNSRPLGLIFRRHSTALGGRSAPLSPVLSRAQPLFHFSGAGSFSLLQPLLAFSRSCGANCLKSAVFLQQSSEWFNPQVFIKHVTLPDTESMSQLAQSGWGEGLTSHGFQMPQSSMSRGSGGWESSRSHGGHNLKPADLEACSTWAPLRMCELILLFL